MAVVYFTNNASTGSGSLAAAVAAAKDGDVIRPDETVFGRGATVEIALASRLDVRKTLTIDGGACRIRLNGGSSVVCLFVREGDATFINVDVVAGRSASTSSFYPGGVRVDASATFKRCRIAGCESQTTGGAMFIASGGVVNLVDCLVAGNRSAAGHGGLAVGGVANVAGSTLVGNVAATGANDVGGGGTVDLTNAIVGVNAINKATSSGSVVGVAPSQIGFVAPPPDDLTSEDWTAELWKSWDLRLLDDANDVPSSCRDSGDVDKTTQYDLDGNFRGRETNGASTCSPGAYETLQADLFWVGADSTGAQVVSPSFLASDGWAASRFAAASGDAAPQLGQTLFVGDSVAFVDAAPQGAALIVGGGASVSTGVDDASRFDLTAGVGATFTVSASAILRRFGDSARILWTAGDLTVATNDWNPTSVIVPPESSLILAGATVRITALTASLTSRIDGAGDLVFALGGRATFDSATTVNGVPISDYAAATNDVRITFETSELVWESRVSGSKVEITDPLLADDRFVFRFDRYANGEFVEFYATDSRVSDDEAPAYETTSNWNGAASPTLVDASAEPGWNYYRVRLDEPVEKGGVLLNAYASPTRYVAVWVGNDEPTRTYYYRGGAKGSFVEPSDWVLTPDGLVPCVDEIDAQGATFCVVDA